NDRPAAARESRLVDPGRGSRISVISDWKIARPGSSSQRRRTGRRSSPGGQMAQGASPISEIGLRLKDFRRRGKLTLAETSGRTGVAVSTLSKIENGQISPSFDIIQRIADGLDMSLEDLVQSGRKSRGSGRQPG